MEYNSAKSCLVEELLIPLQLSYDVLRQIGVNYKINIDMKKCFFSIAVLAASACLVVACGNQSANSDCCADSTEVDEIVDEAREGMDNHTVALPMTRTSFEMNTFTVGVPEGWGTTPNLDPASSEIMVFKGDMEKVMTSPTLVINVDKLEEGKSFDDILEAADAEPDMKSIPGVMIEGKDYRATYLS